MAKKKLTPPQRLRLRALARDIAVDLFGYGVSERADRLVQVVGQPERQLGGWSIGCATDRIYKHLVQAKEPR